VQIQNVNSSLKVELSPEIFLVDPMREVFWDKTGFNRSLFESTLLHGTPSMV